MSELVLAAGFCSLLLTVLLAMISARSMCRTPRRDVSMDDKIVFYAASTIGVGASIVLLSTAVIMVNDFTTLRARSSVVVLTATCVVLIVNVTVKKTIDASQAEYRNNSRKYVQ